MILDILFLIGGLELILVGANMLTDGSSDLARRMGISELVVGLTVVAFGTSTPELVISIISALQAALRVHHRRGVPGTPERQGMDGGGCRLCRGVFSKGELLNGLFDFESAGAQRPAGPGRRVVPRQMGRTPGGLPGEHGTVYQR